MFFMDWLGTTHHKSVFYRISHYRDATRTILICGQLDHHGFDKGKKPVLTHVRLLRVWTYVLWGRLVLHAMLYFGEATI